MMKKSIAAKFFEQKSSPEISNFVNNSIEIADQVHDYLLEKGWTQSEFGQKLGKTDAEVSKWLSGLHNLTLKSIAKMETVLNKKIITTPKVAKEAYKQIKYVQVKEIATTNNRTIFNSYNQNKVLGKNKFAKLKIAI